MSNPLDTDEFTFYFGAASGSSRKALRLLQEPNVMINYATKNNVPWDGIEKLFIDSGGYSFMKGKGEYETSDAEYLDYVEKHDPDVFALRDYPCEPDVLEAHGRTVGDHQRRTTDRHIALMELIEHRDIDSEPLAVLQGWGTDDYLEHLDDLRYHGVLTDRVGIGSVCRRNKEDQIRRVILTVSDAVPPGTDLHAFGVKGSVLKYPDVREALSSADSQSYDMQAQWETLEELDSGSKTWRDSARAYLDQRFRLRKAIAGKDDSDVSQSSLFEVSGRMDSKPITRKTESQ